MGEIDPHRLRRFPQPETEPCIPTLVVCDQVTAFGLAIQRIDSRQRGDQDDRPGDPGNALSQRQWHCSRQSECCMFNCEYCIPTNAASAHAGIAVASRTACDTA